MRAAASDDAALKADYAAGDVYHALARLCGLTTDPDPARWKRENPATRQRMKVLQLAISTAWACRRWRAGSTGTR